MLNDTSHKVFIGYDSRESIAYDVCSYSIQKHATIPVTIIPIKQDELRQQGVYTRTSTLMESTQFSFTRFLVPYITNYTGKAIYCDCDFLFTCDIAELFQLYDNRYAVQVVKHAYVPKNVIKMDNVVQTAYNRKNWSSLMLFNCTHPAIRHLTPDLVNTSSGLYLHQLQWLADSEIGPLDIKWNYLVGVYDHIDNPYALHYTNGGPWFTNYKNCDYAMLWNIYKNEMKNEN